MLSSSEVNSRSLAAGIALRLFLFKGVRARPISQWQTSEATSIRKVR
jgi:hypothetical protein